MPIQTREKVKSKLDGVWSKTNSEPLFTPETIKVTYSISQS